MTFVKCAHPAERSCLKWLTVAVLLANSTAGAQDWTRNFRLGASVSLNLKAEFQASGQFGISGSQPGPPGQSGAEHFYDDGYVRVDETGNAQGYTSFWGYDNDSQYNAGAQTLTMHSAKSFTGNSTSSLESDSPQPGLDLAYGGSFRHWEGAIVGWELGFALLPLSITDNRPFSGVFTRTVHQFNTGGIVVPQAPFNGGSSGLGPTISDTAFALPDDTTAGTITGSRTLDVNYYAVRLGPTLHWEMHPRWAMALSAGAAVGIISGDYRFSETTLLADGGRTTNKGSFGETEVVYGGYAGAVLLFHTHERADIYLGAHFIRSGDAEFSDGGRQARLDLSAGFYISAGINWPF